LNDHRVQGLDNDEVAADWPAIGNGELAWLREHHAALDGDCRVLWHSPRPFSAAALIACGPRRCFVKRHAMQVRSARVLEEEHRFIAHLADAGLPVVQVLPARSGATALEYDGWTYEVHAEGAGEDLYRDSPSWTPLADAAQARTAGAMLARLHHAAADYHAPQRGTHLLVARDELIRAVDPVAALRQQLAERPGLADYLSRQPWEQDLQRAVLPWHRALAGRLQAEPVLWGHNDWHASNLLWNGHGQDATIATIFDFGLASPASALFDLATASSAMPSPGWRMTRTARSPTRISPWACSPATARNERCRRPRCTCWRTCCRWSTWISPVRSGVFPRGYRVERQCRRGLPHLPAGPCGLVRRPARPRPAGRPARRRLTSRLATAAVWWENDR
jgi:Ser/Thr protein kinase RdoA (MazF antagonist)